MILVCKGVVSSRTSTKVAINKRMSDHIYIIGMNSIKQMMGTTKPKRKSHWAPTSYRPTERKEPESVRMQGDDTTLLVGLIKQDVRMLAQAMRGATTLGELMM